ncbi:MAG: DUF2157 domain-containing protein [Sulfurovum sp.]|nr:DUF2157 domain-containing protein [Sulfurovum sp.]
MSEEKLTREKVSSLLIQGNILPQNTEKVLSLTGISPSKHSWYDFINTLLLWLGTLALALSLMFLIAFNWNELGRFAQFALVEVAIVAAIIVYYKTEKESLVSTASLVLASLFLGVLLALFGQTYQTGADTWELFFFWALMILPWTFLSKLPAQWILVITLLNLSMVFYFDHFQSLLWMVFSSDTILLWVLFIFNLSVQIIWELSSYYVKSQSKEAWYIRLLTLASGFPLTWLIVVAILDKENDFLTFITWILYLLGLYLVYKRIKPDLFILAWGCLSVIVVTITFLAKHLLKGFDAGAFFVLALTVIALGTASAYWLKHVHKELKA